LPRPHWDTHAKQAAAAELTVDLDGPAVLADDAVAERQAQAGALADGLCGEKRVENAGQMFRAYARPIVLDFDDDVAKFLSGTDRDDAATAAARLNRVHDQVEKDLIELAGLA